MSIIESELTVFAKKLRKQLGTQHLTELVKDTSFSQQSSPFQWKDLVALCGLLRAQTPEVLLPFLAKNSPFSRIRLLDATSFLIPETFRENFQGSGGTRYTAGIKIQLEYDLLSGQS